MSDSPRSRGKIIVFGIFFFYPLAGVTYQFLHYLLGLRKLGYDAYYVEDSQRDVYDPALGDYTPDATRNIALLQPVLEKHGLAGKWAFRGIDGRCFGMEEPQLMQLYRDADAALNVTGAQEIRDEHRVIRRRIYVESDPFAAQVKVAKGDAGTIAFLDAHDTHFSFGENLGQPDCTVPITRYKWLPTRQPVDMDLWAASPTGGPAYNTVTTWHNKGEGIEWQGDRYYWTKDREFRKFLDLPRRRPNAAFEMATTTDPAVTDLLHSNGWRTTDSLKVSGDADTYRRYIQNSRGEFTVARDQYNRPRTGWSSDRSVCYLAAGRPVITQETGFSKFVPCGRGLFAYQTMDDILAAVDAIESDYPGHCRAARDIAAEYFSTQKVLASLLSRAGL